MNSRYSFAKGTSFLRVHCESYLYLHFHDSNVRFQSSPRISLSCFSQHEVFLLAGVPYSIMQHIEQAREIMPCCDLGFESKRNLVRKDWQNCANCNSASPVPSSADEIHQDKRVYNPFIVILTADQARSIYLLRSASSAGESLIQTVAGKSSLVAEMFGVNPKTIRDVWSRKTWTKVSLAVSAKKHVRSLH